MTRGKWVDTLPDLCFDLTELLICSTPRTLTLEQVRQELPRIIGKHYWPTEVEVKCALNYLASSQLISSGRDHDGLLVFWRRI